jgi:hypothetical protein
MPYLEYFSCMITYQNKPFLTLRLCNKVFVHEVESSGHYHIFVFIPVVEQTEQLQIYKVIYICYLNKYY